MIQGKTAIHGMVARGFALPGFHVTWRPQFAAVSASADHGYTRGTDEFTLPNKNDGTTTLPGRYRTGWRRGTDGVEAAPRRCRRQERNSLSISEWRYRTNDASRTCDRSLPRPVRGSTVPLESSTSTAP
jgi:hypothetical protein